MIIHILKDKPVGETIQINGWVRFFRNDRFIALNDGSTIHNIQLVLPDDTAKDTLQKITVGCSVQATGEITASEGKGQDIEMQVKDITVLGLSNADDYPLQPKRHSIEFLREKAALRPRTNLFGAILRVRHELAQQIHRYFSDRGYIYTHTPIITASDCEGAGEMFNLSSTELDTPFFGKEAHLTVSGQLDGEIAMMGLGKVYTFGPTFRAENSNTTRHLAEFWMVEPEIAFTELPELMGIATDFVQTVVKHTLANRADDIDFLHERHQNEQKQKGKQGDSWLLKDKLDFVVNNDFVKISYTEAIDILKNSKHNKKGKFQYSIDQWGADLQSEHERYLVEKHFKSPVIIYNYPANIKAFYMKANNEETQPTVAAMDVLFPGIGEIIGGSQREENLDTLIEKMKAFDIPVQEMQWYLDTRRFGTVPHSGFGLGFERLVQFVTGMGNIRDVVLSPRAVNYIAY